MLRDTKLDFQEVGNPLSIVGGLGAVFPTTGPTNGVYDIVGSGPGTPPINIIGTQTAFGSDTGVGGIKVMINAVIGIQPVTVDGATLEMAFQGAPDTGPAGGFLPGAFVDFETTGFQSPANLTPGTVLRLTWPEAFPASENPRFVRVVFRTPAGTQFTAGTISSVIVVDVRDDYSIKYAQKNFVV
jgi:hypothetical protein